MVSHAARGTDADAAPHDTAQASTNSIRRRRMMFSTCSPSSHLKAALPRSTGDPVDSSATDASSSAPVRRYACSAGGRNLPVEATAGSAPVEWRARPRLGADLQWTVGSLPLRSMRSGTVATSRAGRPSTTSASQLRRRSGHEECALNGLVSAYRPKPFTAGLPAIVCGQDGRHSCRQPTRVCSQDALLD